ncbi:MAG TPA: MFS transporter, partial [Spirochaetia bacterium]|nr:MFS transporter [Spirochaetia bacterium]
LPNLGVAPAQVPAWTGRVTALAGLVGIPLLPLWGALADRFSRQPVIVRSFAVHLLSGILMLLAGNLWVFAMGRALTGFALGNSGLMMTTLSERAPRARTGFALAIMNSAAPIGAFAGPLFGGPAVDRWGFPTLLAADAGLMLVVIVALSVGYRDTFRAAQRKPILRMALESVGIVIRSALLRSLFAALFLLFAGWMLVMTYVPLVVTGIYRGSNPATVVGLVLGLGGLSALAVGPLMGALADRLGHWQVLFYGAALSTVLWPVPMFTTGIVAFAMTWGIVNGISSGVFAVSFVVLSESSPQAVRGRVMSFAYLPVNLGIFVGPAIGSALSRMNVKLVFPTAAVLTGIGILVLIGTARLGRERLPSS